MTTSAPPPLATPAPFDAIARYYDLLYRDKDYVAEVAYIDALLRAHRIGGPDLLEFGAGTGGHGRLLAERGYRVTGVERNPGMVARAIQTEGFRCIEADIQQVSLNRLFDAVLALFHVVSYQVSNHAAQAVFSRAAEHLAPGGLFVFDVWYSPAVLAQRPETRIKRLHGDGMDVTRIAEPVIYPNENRVDVNYTMFVRDTVSGAVQTITEVHPMRHFSLPEIDLLAAAAGFGRVRAEAFLSGDEPGEATWGLCVVLERLASRP